MSRNQQAGSLFAETGKMPGLQWAEMPVGGERVAEYSIAFLTSRLISDINKTRLMKRYLPAMLLFCLCYAGAMQLAPRKSGEGNHVPAASLLNAPFDSNDDSYARWKESIENAKDEQKKLANDRAKVKDLESRNAAAKEVEKAIADANSMKQKNALLQQWVVATSADETWKNLLVNHERLQKKADFKVEDVAKLPFLDRLDRVVELRALSQEVMNYNSQVKQAAPHLQGLLAKKPKDQPE